MKDLNPKSLRARAQQCLGGAGYDPWRLVAIHVGALLLLNLLSNGLHLYLDAQIEGTGGLGGLGTRTVLQTIQMALSYGNLIFTPFWQAGFVLIAIRWATRAATGPKELWSGFRRFGTVISYQLFEMMLLMLLAYTCAQVASIIFSFTPWAVPFYEVMEPAMVDGMLDMNLVMALPADEFLRACLPLMGVMGAIFVPLWIFISYRLRLAVFFVMEPAVRFGGATALFASFRATKGHVGKLFRLDLSWWWYYGLEMLLTAVLYLDSILPAMGISLPVNETVAYFISLILYGVLELALQMWKRAEVETTYALAYREIIKPPEQEAE